MGVGIAYFGVAHRIGVPEMCADEVHRLHRRRNGAMEEVRCLSPIDVFHRELRALDHDEDLRAA